MRIRPDGSHFDVDGARYASEQLVPQLLALLHAPKPASPPPSTAAAQVAQPPRQK
jgi:hypothetical protein